MSSRYTPEELFNKYVRPPSTPENAATIAEAEQLSQAVLDSHRACDAYNAAHQLDWLTLELPQALRDRIGQYQTRLREAQSRDSLAASAGSNTLGRIVSYYDDRNSYDEANGWPAFNPDIPRQQNVPFGHIVSDRTPTVHVLRGGTEPMFDARDGRGHYERPTQPDDMPDWGPSYDFAAFFRTAERRHIVRFCDLHLPGGCENGIGGGPQKLAAIPLGRDIFMVSLCRDCREVLEQQFAEAHPTWRGPNPMSRRRRL